MMSIYRFLVSLALLCVFLLSSSAAYALVADQPLAVDSRIKTLVYSPNEVYGLLFGRGFEGVIEFGIGEYPRYVRFGTASAWAYTVEGNRLFLSPLEDGSHTNLLVLTSKRRLYVFDTYSLRTRKEVVVASASSPGPGAASPPGATSATDATKDAFEGLNMSAEDPESLTYVVRFYYPQDVDQSLDSGGDITIPYFSMERGKRLADANVDSLIRGIKGVSYEVLELSRSSDVSKGGSLGPTEAFDDGSVTYLKFVDMSNLPDLSVSGEGGQLVYPKMLKFHGYVVLSGVYGKLYLNYGDGNLFELVRYTR